MGLRLSGIDGVCVHSREEALSAMSSALEDGGIGIILVTEKISKLIPEFIYEVKHGRPIPLIVEIPDRHGSGRAADAITSYIRDAIGVKL